MEVLWGLPREGMLISYVKRFFYEIYIFYFRYVFFLIVMLTYATMKRSLSRHVIFRVKQVVLRHFVLAKIMKSYITLRSLALLNSK
ncbi:hypothetical protein DOX53_16615 [Cronobacter malonaticus]|nr:hypothetical protein [Cronobacter malonaticus]EGT4489338.1 hypothetical protein [Cronobacter malonaticus]